MNVIDQRILIPANPDVIWDVISNINDNPKWQVNCQQVSFLTTNHTGQGLRYRSTSSGGRDMVIEISAWYENVGYAYKIIDGISTRSNSGRFRLQEITEGTIVQWAFEYEPSGLLGGIKNSLSTKRTFEREIVQSLENLWRVITQLQAGKPYISRTAMREAPDVESRAQYKTRHDKPISPVPTDNDALSSFLKLDEPPIKQDDTRPHPAEPTPPSGIAPIVKDDIFSKTAETAPSEPDFLRSLDAPVSTADHSLFQPPVPEKVDEQPVVEPVTTPEPIQEPTESAKESQTEIESLFSFEETSTPVQEPSTIRESLFVDPIIEPEKPVEQPTEEPVTLEPASTTPTEPKKPVFEALTPVEEPITPEPIIEPVVKDGDTSQMSIFEIFGLPKPSDTQQIKPVVIEQHLPLITDAKPISKPEPQASSTPVEPVEAVASVEPISADAGIANTEELNDAVDGLRAKLRRKNSKVRRRA